MRAEIRMKFITMNLLTPADVWAETMHNGCISPLYLLQESSIISTEKLLLQLLLQ